MKADADVLVVGASLAGAALALSLSRRGLRVMLFDKASFPRRKPCGDGLSALGMRELEQLGFADSFMALPHAPFSGYRIREGRNDAVFACAAGIPGYGVARGTLDTLLQESVQQEAGIARRFQHKINTAQIQTNSVTVRCGGTSFCGRFLVLADGCNSLIAKRLGIPAVQTPEQRYGISVTLSGTFERDFPYVELFPAPGFEIYATRVSSEELTFSVLGSSASVKRFAEQNAMKQAVEVLYQQTGFRGQIASEIQFCGPIGAKRRSPGQGNVFLIGDSCECLDPVAGLGMTHALLSARFAADSIYAATSGALSVAAASMQYRRRRELAVRPLRGFTRLTYFLICRSHPWLRGALAHTALPERVRESLSFQNKSSAYGTLLAAGGALRSDYRKLYREAGVQNGFNS